MEHLADELHRGGLVGVLLFEMHDEAEGAVFEGSIGGANYDGVPEMAEAVSGRNLEQLMRAVSSYHVMTLSATGEADTPAGGSVCMRC
jgi:hypothetical protein